MTSSLAAMPCWAPVTLLLACFTRPARKSVPTVLAPSHITVWLLKLAVGSGRRKKSRFAVVPKLNGSLAAVTLNSAVAGGLRSRRNLPWRSMLYDAWRASTVDTSEVGVFASMMLNSGCVPPVSANSRLPSNGVMPQPDETRWHVPQSRPLVPCGVLNSFVRSMDPWALNTAENPAGLRNGKLFGRWSIDPAAVRKSSLDIAPAVSSGRSVQEAAASNAEPANNEHNAPVLLISNPFLCCTFKRCSTIVWRRCSLVKPQTRASSVW